MDADRFDALSRSLTSVGFRRRALAGLVSGALGLVGAWTKEATAKNCKKIKNKAKRKKCLAKAKPGDTPPLPSSSCPEGQRVCNGACIPSNQCCTNGDCPASTPTCCGGACVNVLTDIRHCGRCGAGCSFNEHCSVGACWCVIKNGCANGLSCCTLNDGFCYCGPNFSTPAPTTCGSASSCPAGTTPCTASTQNCGPGLAGQACCPAGTRCDEGTCRYV